MADIPLIIARRQSIRNELENWFGYDKEKLHIVSTCNLSHYNQSIMVESGMGVALVMAFAQYFTGNSYLNPLTDPKETAVFLANVTFEPGCRNNWHIHHAKSGGGQLLVCTAGSGWYQEEGSEALARRKGG